MWGYILSNRGDGNHYFYNQTTIVHLNHWQVVNSTDRKLVVKMKSFWDIIILLLKEQMEFLKNLGKAYKINDIVSE